jgi:RimJ/RimL family protein N-acetyltransferase
MRHIGKPFEIKPLQDKFAQRLKSWHRDTFEWLNLVVELKNPPAPDSPMRKDHASIGVFGLRCINLESRIVEVYLLLDKPHEGQGHGSEVLTCMSKYIFYNLNFHKICATCSINNTNALQMLEHNNFHKEGTLRDNSFLDGHFVNDHYYGLLKADLS